jgi:hypothetical protein
LISKPEVIAARPTVEPTERSMPPVRITKVIPTAIIAVMAVWPTRIIRFSSVKNDFESTEKIPISTKSAMSALSLKSKTPRNKPDDLLGSAAEGETGDAGAAVFIWES